MYQVSAAEPMQQVMCTKRYGKTHANHITCPS